MNEANGHRPFQASGGGAMGNRLHHTIHASANYSSRTAPAVQPHELLLLDHLPSYPAKEFIVLNPLQTSTAKEFKSVLGSSYSEVLTPNSPAGVSPGYLPALSSELQELSEAECDRDRRQMITGTSFLQQLDTSINV